MEGPEAPVVHHKKALHSKRSFGKYPRPIDSPAYDASEEDNDPLTDDGASAISVLLARHATTSSTVNAPSIRASTFHPKASNRARHQLAASLVSDDGIDSPTYDGDVESSTVGTEHNHTIKSFYHPPALHHSASSTSTLNTPATSRPTFSITSPGPSISEDAPTNRAAGPDAHPVFISQHVNAAAVPLRVPDEPQPVPAAEAAFGPSTLTVENIRAFVQKAIEDDSSRPYKIQKPPIDRPVRIYADGVYDLFHFGHALQLRQAKLSFPSVYLLVGVCSDELVKEHKARSIMTHAERCETARHCRWVDEIVQDAPWVIDADFLDKWEIDYVAHDEQPYASTTHDDVYAFVKSQGKFLPTRRTPGISTSELLERIVTGYRKRDFDDKLTKMGHAELKAEGSDYDDSRPGSRVLSRSGSPKPHAVPQAQGSSKKIDAV